MIKAMADYEKIIKATEQCIKDDPMGCLKCDYFPCNGGLTLQNDTLDLIKNKDKRSNI